MYKLLFTTCRSPCIDELLEHLVRLSQVGDTASDELIQPADDRLGRACPDGDDGAIGTDGGLLVVLAVRNRGIGGRGDVDEGSSFNIQSEALRLRDTQGGLHRLGGSPLVLQAGQWQGDGGDLRAVQLGCPQFILECGDREGGDCHPHVGHPDGGGEDVGPHGEGTYPLGEDADLVQGGPGSARLLLDVGDTESRRVDPVADVGVGRELEHGQVLDVNVDTDVAWGSGPDVVNWPDYGSE